MTLKQAQDKMIGTPAVYVEPDQAKSATAQIYLDMVPKIGGTIQGNITLNQSAANTTLALNGPSGQIQRLSLNTGGKRRWAVYSSSAVETGSNKGSNFSIGRYNDSGVFIDTPLSINRATGEVTLSKSPTTAMAVATKDYVDKQIAAIKALL